MTAFPFDIVGFDLDGTLFDTSGDIAAALNHALALAGRPALAVEAVKPMIGLGSRNLLDQALEATGGRGTADTAALNRELLRYYEANIARTTAPFPGLLDAMAALDARGVKLAIVTNKVEARAAQLVGELGMSHRFAALIGGDTMGEGNAKPSALPIREMIRRCQALGGGGRAAFVGDSIFDIMAAKNAGIPSVAVSFGFLMQPVEELGADAVIGHFDALIPALERLGR